MVHAIMSTSPADKWQFFVRPISEVYSKCFYCFLIGNMLLFKNPNDAGLASLRVLRNSRWRPRWPPFLALFYVWDYNAVFPILFCVIDINMHGYIDKEVHK